MWGRSTLLPQLARTLNFTEPCFFFLSATPSNHPIYPINLATNGSAGIPAGGFVPARKWHLANLF
jgi:hypothetical protein